MNPFALEVGMEYEDVIEQHGTPVEMKVDSTSRSERGHYGSVNPLRVPHMTVWIPQQTYKTVHSATLRYRNAILYFGKGGKLAYWLPAWGF